LVSGQFEGKGEEFEDFEGFKGFKGKGEDEEGQGEGFDG
jgi:hypothetical protein